jgi:hypothetical protein
MEGYKTEQPPQPYPYVPLPDNDHIRILVIGPASGQEHPIDCAMLTARIDAGEYDALSYSWGMNDDGDTTPNRTISIDNKTVQVTQNLFEGLLRMRQNEAAIHLWVDAVCINQDNLEERNAQVTRMGDIYSHAYQVRIWLGEGQTEEEDVLIAGFLSRIANHTPSQAGHPDDACHAACFLDAGEAICGCIRSRETYSDYLYFEEEEQRWISHHLTSDARYVKAVAMYHALSAFIQRRYWGRRWVVQELIRGKNWRCYWGSCQWKFQSDLWFWLWENFSHPTFRNIQKCLPLRSEADTQRIPANFAREDFDTLLFNDGMTRQMRSMADIRFAKSWTRTPWNWAMYSWKDTQCSDPKDRLYALSGICSPVIEVDYKLSIAEVYTKFATMLLQEGQSNDIFDNLRNSSTDERNSVQLPSWVPDLRSDFNLTAFDCPMLPFVVRSDMSLVCQARSLGVLYRALPREDSLSSRESIENGAFDVFVLHQTGSVPATSRVELDIMKRLELPSDVTDGDVLISTAQDWESTTTRMLVLRPVSRLPSFNQQPWFCESARLDHKIVCARTASKLEGWPDIPFEEYRKLQDEGDSRWKPYIQQCRQDIYYII